MRRLLVAYTTYDGHTAKIAERIASTAHVADCAVEVCDLARMAHEDGREARRRRYRHFKELRVHRLGRC